MKYLAVTNWERYQHYSGRNMPWVKFYVELADPRNKLNDLPVSTRFLFDRLLLLAATYANAIPNDCELIANLLRISPESCGKDIEQLLKGRWIKEKRTRRSASTNLKTRYHKSKSKKENKNPKAVTSKTDADNGPGAN